MFFLVYHICIIESVHEPVSGVQSIPISYTSPEKCQRCSLSRDGTSRLEITEVRTSLMQRLDTRRLKLLPFTLQLKKVTLVERARLTELLGVAIPDAWPGADLQEALPFFIEAMEQDALGLVWDGIILHKADQVAIGGIGFHGPPDESGRVEIGYNIIPAYEGQGYATEMARRVID